MRMNPAGTILIPKGLLRAFLLLPLILVAEISVGDQSMRSIKDFLEKENASNRVAGQSVDQQFVGLRCASLFSILSRFTYENGMIERASIFEAAQNRALDVAVKGSTTVNEEFIVGQIKIMISAYTERWKRAKALTGNFADDEVISSDLDTCTKVFGKTD